MSDSFDADLHGADTAAHGRHVVSLHVYDRPRDVEDSLHTLAKQLTGADFSEYEPETGFFDVTVAAPDRDTAIQRVWEAIGSSGADDHIELAEHPDTPEHWRNKQR